MASRVKRSVVSYVRRSPRMNTSQLRAYERWGGRYLIPGLARTELDTVISPQDPLDLAEVFGRTAPLAIEIGTGAGENLAAQACAHPDWNLLAFEVYDKAIATTVANLARADVDNVRLIDADGVSGLTHLIEPASVNILWTYFPDPWHKKRHHKRRLISREFGDLVADRLVPGGQWRIATDWDDYAEAIIETLSECDGLVNQYPQGAPRDVVRPITKYENRGINAGHTVHDFVFKAAK